MKIGDLVTIGYRDEADNYYIIIDDAGRQGEYGEQQYRLESVFGGDSRVVRYTDIRIVQKSERETKNV